jgi:hypothetical protein
MCGEGDLAGEREREGCIELKSRMELELGEVTDQGDRDVVPTPALKPRE